MSRPHCLLSCLNNDLVENYSNSTQRPFSVMVSVKIGICSLNFFKTGTYVAQVFKGSHSGFQWNVLAKIFSQESGIFVLFPQETYNL